ncbi:MAG TPA: hypothetical protein IAA26_11220 [Candidatus Blautia faecipullorum]|nr:hypothetical protein [Candidatus Blautia faecipullorum]
MIKYGLNGLPLRGRKETETVLTEHGLVRRKKEAHEDDTAVKIAERLASRNANIDNELLARILGKTVEEVETEEEKTIRKIKENIELSGKSWR